MKCCLCKKNKPSFMIWDLDKPTCICSNCDRNHIYIKEHDVKNKYKGYYNE